MALGADPRGRLLGADAVAGVVEVREFAYGVFLALLVIAVLSKVMAEVVR